MPTRALLYLTVAAAAVVPVHFGAQGTRYQKHSGEAPQSVVAESAECHGAREERPVIPDEEHAYLGKSPPGLEPVPFAPGILPDSLDWHSAPVFSPDGNEVYFSSFVFRRRYSETIFCMRLVDGEWTRPEVAPFSGRHFEGAPCLVPDGNVLFYSSSRSGGAGEDPGQNRCLHYVERRDDGWGEPAKVPIRTGGWAGRPHFSESGNLYYTAGGDLYRVGVSDAGYLEPEKLPGEINTGAYAELDPCIAPDESFIVFFSSRPGGYSSESSELYVCFRTEDGSWTEAVNLGPQVNGGCMMVRFPKISPDGKYFFFSRTSEPFGDEIYWVSLDYVKSLRP
jgi:Tol biopolymer transport system component